MATRIGETLARQLAELRIEPTAKRVRASLGSVIVADSERALLVWEPRRLVPGYAVPEADIAATITPTEAAGGTERYERFAAWDPRVPFSVRLTPGQAVTVTAGDRVAAGFRAEDPDLAGYVILDFGGFDSWLEDDDPIISHPHSPFSRIDVRDTSRRMRIALDGVTIADTTRARILYETGLPPRFYLPRDDVTVELQPSSTRSTCAYKGHARYYSPVIDGMPRADLAWSYEDPLVDGLRVAGYVAFFDEKLDVTIDGVPRKRPLTVWS